MKLNPNSRLVQFEASDGLKLEGLLAYAETDTTIIHIHGICGNFYANEFIRKMAEIYPKIGINFFSINHRGHDVLAETYVNDEVVYVGGGLEKFSETMCDIQGAVDFVSSFSRRTILQGHSGGCAKTIYYNLNNEPLETILMSPTDSYELHSKYLEPETVNDQYRRLEEITQPSDSWTWYESEYGIDVAGMEYNIPITHQALLALHEGPAFQILRFDGRWPFDKIDTRILACIGSDDPYQTVPPSQLQEELSKMAEHIKLLEIAGADHHFHGFEEKLLNGISNWLDFN